MQSIQTSTLDALERTQKFLDANASLVGSVITTTLRTELDNAVAQFAASAVEQDTTDATSKGETFNQGVMRQQIRSRYMRPIARMAAMRLRGVAAYPVLTPSTSRMPLGDFIVAARAMIAAATDNVAVLTSTGMTTDLIPSFTTAVTTLASSVDNRGRSRARRAASTAVLGDQAKRGRSLLDVIDAFIEPVIAGNAELLAEWQSTSRVLAKPGPVAGAKKPVAPVVPVVPAVPVAPIGATVVAHPAEHAASAAPASTVSAEVTAKVG